MKPFKHKQKNNQAESDMSSATGAVKSPAGLARIKNIIAVASGKGGVGKSTLATNLAVALASLDYRVGLMDADIYGPSQPKMLGSVNDQPGIRNNILQPIKKYGIDFISLGILIPDGGPVIWRAPMANKIIQQFIGNVHWGELDYLLIDLPPGTGDVQLTLAQQATLTGSVIVTTPQQVALGVAQKGLKMFEQVNIPILGVIENMSGFTCSHCGKETDIFKSGGGADLAKLQQAPFLGTISIDPEVMNSGDDGIPVLIRNKDSRAAKQFLYLAERMIKQVEQVNASSDEPEAIKLSDNGQVLINWADGHRGIYSSHNLRCNCPCAECVDENTGERLLPAGEIRLDIKVGKFERIGRYALLFDFSDGHNVGIFSFKLLRELCECESCRGKNGKAETFAV